MSQARTRKATHNAADKSVNVVFEDTVRQSHDMKNGVPAAEDEEVEDSRRNEHGLEGDRGNISLLIFLYVLQGIPLGLAGSIPYLLQSRHVSYKDQAIFSFVYWPFSVKLLWAPIVDAAYWRWFGRRKSWLVPVQYLLGIFMLFLSTRVPQLLGETDSSEAVDVLTLTITFFMLNFLAATQDIAVDGWALTMLARRNVGWASTCNSIGQTCGFFLGNVVFLALESPEFCNNHLRSEPSDKGLVTLDSFLFFWGIVFLVTTTLVMLFKRETSSSQDPEPNQGILATYKNLSDVIRLPAVLSLIFVLMTIKIGFAAADAVTGLKLIEEGVPREKLALLGIPMVPIQVLLPLLISKYTTSDQPLNVALKAMPYRLLMGLEFALVVWWAPSTKTAEGEYPMYFYFVVFCSYAVHQIFLYCMFVSLMAFHARVSDPVIGGTYMTLLNTLTNLGGNWPSTLALWLVDALTWKRCQIDSMSCNSKVEEEACQEAGSSCEINIDGYYVESVACVLLGFWWIRLFASKLRNIQALPASAWSCAH